MRKGFPSLWGVYLAIALFALALTRTQASTVKKAVQFQPEFKQGEVLVQLKKNKLSAYGMQANALLASLSKKYTASISHLQTDKSLVKVVVKENVAMSQLIADIQGSSQVEFAEPNYIYRASLVEERRSVVPNDPNFANNWGLLNTGQRDPKGQVGTAGSDIDATLAWATGTGSRDMIVAVIDTGVDYNHEDLKDNIYVNSGEIEGNGKDDDGNGFIDDVRGWDFQQKDNNPMDDNRHGTHCAGTIGAVGDNGVGTAGVAWQVRIVPIKFLSAGGSGSLADAVESIKYATKLGVHVMSNSWGGGGFSQAMFNAIQEAKEKGILFVAAAGNEGNNNDSSPAYPASYEIDNVISVAATDNKDQKASWSNYGVRKVHLAAPGVNIYSTVPGNRYDTFSGTSMACPHVSGAAALLWSLNKDMSFADVKQRLISTVDPVRSIKRKVISGGRLNVYNAINNIVPERSEPPADQWKAVAKAIESAHPYANGANVSFDVSHPGARFIRLHFSKVGTESGYDFVRVKNAAGEVIEELSGSATDYTTDYIEGDKLTITLNSDASVDGFGFSVDRYEFID